MKEIKITQVNSQKIEDALRAINGLKVAHSYVHYDDIENLTVDAESRLINLLGAKKNFVGAIFDAISGAAVPTAYKYSRAATSVALARKACGWYLVIVASTVIYQQGGKKILRLTEDQDTIVYKKLRTNYRIQSLSE